MDADSILTAPNRVATTYFASSHNTSAAAVLAASYSRTSTLIRSITILARKLAVCKSSANRRSEAK